MCGVEVALSYVLVMISLSGCVCDIVHHVYLIMRGMGSISVMPYVTECQYLIVSSSLYEILTL